MTQLNLAIVILSIDLTLLIVASYLVYKYKTFGKIRPVKRNNKLIDWLLKTDKI